MFVPSVFVSRYSIDRVLTSKSLCSSSSRKRIFSELKISSAFPNFANFSCGTLCKRNVIELFCETILPTTGLVNIRWSHNVTWTECAEQNMKSNECIMFKWKLSANYSFSRLISHRIPSHHLHVRFLPHHFISIKREVCIVQFTKSNAAEKENSKRVKIWSGHLVDRKFDPRRTNVVCKNKEAAEEWVNGKQWACCEHSNDVHRMKKNWKSSAKSLWTSMSMHLYINICFCSMCCSNDSANLFSRSKCIVVWKVWRGKKPFSTWQLGVFSTSHCVTFVSVRSKRLIRHNHAITNVNISGFSMYFIRLFRLHLI